MIQEFRPDELEAVKNSSIVTECPECDVQFYDSVKMCYNCGFLITDNDW